MRYDPRFQVIIHRQLKHGLPVKQSAMSSDDDDDISRESASEASDNDRSARFSRNTDDDHSQSQYKKSRRDEEEERDFEKDHCRFIETDQPAEVDPDSIGMIKVVREAALKVYVHKCMVRLHKMSKDLCRLSLHMHNCLQIFASKDFVLRSAGAMILTHFCAEKRRRKDSDTKMRSAGAKIPTPNLIESV